MNIGLDLDGVLANIDVELIHRMKSAGYDSDINAWHSYFIEENHPEIPVEWIIKQFNDDKFWNNSIPYDDAWYHVKKWFDRHDIFIITSRPVAKFGVTQDWLEKWQIDYTQLYCGAAKYHKDAYLDKLKLDLFIEDDPLEAKIIGEKLECQSYLMDRIYNRKYDIGNAIRVKDFYDMETYL